MIRPLSMQDFDAMYEWMHDPNVTRHLQADFASKSREEVKDFIARSAEQGEDAAALHYAIVDESNSYMGTVSLKNIDRRNKNAEYAIATRSEAHGKGYAFSGTMDILKVAFEDLLLEKVYLCVTTDNHAANRFYEKCGFSEEGVFRKHLVIEGSFVDLRWYSMLAEEYQSCTTD